MTQKQCTRCGETKAFDDFHHDRTTEDGHTFWCKPCMNEQHRAGRAARSDDERAATSTQSHTYYMRNRQKILAQRHVYQRAHREQSRAAKRRRYPARKDEINLHRRQRHQEAPERARAREALCRAIQRGDIVRQACEVCGSVLAIVGHHEDYAQPLEVRWLCSGCHWRVHNGEIRLGPADKYMAELQSLLEQQA